MKALRQAYQDALDSGVAALTYCLRVERTDGVIHRWTSHDRALTMQDTGAVYLPDRGGADVSAVSDSGELSAATFDLEGALTANGVSREAIIAGRFDFATVYLFRTLWDDPYDDDEELGKGFWGPSELSRGRYVTEFRSLASQLDQRIGRVHGATCDADLGDSRCKVDLDALAVTGTVDIATSPGQFTDGARTEAADYFGAGTVTFTTGANAGIAREVKKYALDEFTLWQPMPYAIAVGDAYEARPGCRKRYIEDCKNKFSNTLNFRGFPHIPGRDATTKFGGQQ